MTVVPKLGHTSNHVVNFLNANFKGRGLESDLLGLSISLCKKFPAGISDRASFLNHRSVVIYDLSRLIFFKF